MRARPPAVIAALVVTLPMMALSSGYHHATVQESSSIELYIDRGNEVENKNIFDQILSLRDMVEKHLG